MHEGERSSSLGGVGALSTFGPAGNKKIKMLAQ
jgi:hypothetical protein